MSGRVRACVSLAFAVLIGAAFVAPAVAVPADAVVVSQTTETVSGVELVSQVLSNLDKVALGANGATVTLDVDGQPHDIALDLGDAVQGGVGSRGLGGLAVVAAVAAGLFKGAAMLVRAMR